MTPTVMSKGDIGLHLMRLGAIPGFRGFPAMREAVAILLETDQCIPAAQLYQRTAERLGPKETPARVERNCRFLREKMVDNPGPAYGELSLLVGSPNLHRMMLAQFLATVAEWMRVKAEHGEPAIITPDVLKELTEGPYLRRTGVAVGE